MSSLAELLFKDYRRRVLALLLLHPERSYHVREIARLTETVPGTLHKELVRLEKAGILTKNSVGNQIQYRANRNCPIFEELASILRKTSGMVEMLIDALTPFKQQIHAAFVFGSIASGKESAYSDIDVLVIGDVTFSEVVNAFYRPQDRLQREINPKVYSHKEWVDMQKKPDAFIKNILTKPKLFIIGSADDLG